MTITLDDVRDHLEGFKSYGGYGMAICPFHDDHSPSMRVSDHGYKCMSCGAKGGLSFLYQTVSGRIVTRQKTYNRATKIWDDWMDRFGSIKSICSIAYTELTRCQDLGDYLWKRGFTMDTVVAGKLGYLDGFYTFPVKDEYNEIQGLVVRASPTIQTKDTRYSVSPNCPVKLYVPSWKSIRHATEIYVCFGTLDAWSLTVAGYPAVTGISGQELNWENLNRFNLPMWGIPDVNEEKSMFGLQRELGWRMKVLRLDYPDDCKDIQDVHRKYGLEKLKLLIEEKKKEQTYA